MSSVILSCPFCHQKGEYRDAPPNSTIRCHECDSMFRVPANAFAKHKPGTVLKGEQKVARSPALKIVLIVGLALVIAGAGWYVWHSLTSVPSTEPDDPYLAQAKFPAIEPAGVLERFLLCWKDVGDPTKKIDAEAVLKYCRPCDRAKLKDGTDASRKDFEDLIENRIINVVIASYDIKGQVRSSDPAIVPFMITLTAQDKKTKGDLKGSVQIRVVQDETAAGKNWGVDFDSAVPKWE